MRTLVRLKDRTKMVLKSNSVKEVTKWNTIEIGGDIVSGNIVYHHGKYYYYNTGQLSFCNLSIFQNHYQNSTIF